MVIGKAGFDRAPQSDMEIPVGGTQLNIEDTMMAQRLGHYDTTSEPHTAPCSVTYLHDVVGQTMLCAAALLSQPTDRNMT